MPGELERIIQAVVAAPERQSSCRRAVCRRHRRCVPPRDWDHPVLFRWPFEQGDDWPERVERAAVIGRRLMKVIEASRAARGLPSPFRPAPPPDPLDLTKPLDMADLLSRPVNPSLPEAPPRPKARS